MIRIGFWNIHKKELAESVAIFFEEHKLDILALAECPYPYAILRSLNTNTSDKYHYKAFSTSSKIRVFTAHPLNFIEELAVVRGLRYNLCSLKMPGAKEITLCLAHLTSKFPYSREPEAEAREMRRSIDVAEKVQGHTRTIVIGDLNQHPYDESILHADGLNAVMSKNIARSGPRNIRKKEHEYFYNPMWNMMGDDGPTGGTYYHDGGGVERSHWTSLDQVLIRPSLLDYLLPESVSIITTLGNNSLLDDNGLPNKAKYSDHLPIKLELNI